MLLKFPFLQAERPPFKLDGVSFSTPDCQTSHWLSVSFSFLPCLLGLWFASLSLYLVDLARSCCHVDVEVKTSMLSNRDFWSSLYVIGTLWLPRWSQQMCREFSLLEGLRYTKAWASIFDPLPYAIVPCNTWTTVIRRGGSSEALFSQHCMGEDRIGGSFFTYSWSFFTYS